MNLLRDPWTSLKLREAFSVWFCRRGRRWCWRERSTSEFRTHAAANTEGSLFGSRRQAWDDVKSELQRRRELQQLTLAPA